MFEREDPYLGALTKNEWMVWKWTMNVRM